MVLGLCHVISLNCLQISHTVGVDPEHVFTIAPEKYYRVVLFFQFFI
jgi:hypothetical protein